MSSPAISSPSTVPPTARPGSDFADLGRLIRAAGLLERRPGAYAVRTGLTVGAYAATWYVVVLVGASWWQCLVAVLLGLTSTQVAFLGHDGGHQQIFARRLNNDLFGRVVANALLGLSFGWWVGKHNRHHANPNKEDHDPDIGDGVLVFTTGQVAARTGGLGRAITRYQAWLFFPFLTLEGLHLHWASLMSLRSGGERSCRGGKPMIEVALLTAHFLAYFGAVFYLMSPLQGLVFIAIHQGVWGLYMGCSFAAESQGHADHRPRRRG